MYLKGLFFNEILPNASDLKKNKQTKKGFQKVQIW